MQVKDLIESLLQYPQDLIVIVPESTEYCVLEKSEVRITEARLLRKDGWVANARPDKPTQKYVTIGC